MGKNNETCDIRAIQQETRPGKKKTAHVDGPCLGQSVERIKEMVAEEMLKRLPLGGHIRRMLQARIESPRNTRNLGQRTPIGTKRGRTERQQNRKIDHPRTSHTVRKKKKRLNPKGGTRPVCLGKGRPRRDWFRIRPTRENGDPDPWVETEEIEQIMIRNRGRESSGNPQKH